MVCNYKQDILKQCVIIMYIKEEEIAQRKAELKAEYEAKLAAKKAAAEEQEEEEEDDGTYV